VKRLDLTEAQWKRVSPKYIWVELVGQLIFAVIVVGVLTFGAMLIGNPFLFTVPASLAVIFILTLALTPRRVRAIGYQLRDDDLLFRKGILFQRFVSVPYAAGRHQSRPSRPRARAE